MWVIVFLVVSSFFAQAYDEYLFEKINGGYQLRGISDSVFSDS